MQSASAQPPAVAQTPGPSCSEAPWPHTSPRRPDRSGRYDASLPARLPARRPIAVRRPRRSARVQAARPRGRAGARGTAPRCLGRARTCKARAHAAPDGQTRSAPHRLLMRREPQRGPLPFDRLQNAPAIASGRAGTGSMDGFGLNQPAQAVIRSLGRSFKGWARCGGPITRAWLMGQGAARVCRGLEVSLLVALLVRTSPAAIALPPERRLPHTIAKQVSRVAATTSGVSTLPWVSGNPGIIILH